ncbi:hypothetical protein CFP56_036642 [Quercus suber]|uniref:RNase H type-1 domain-containing protein n=1 Tax=Quercus suber TaxID=58331 RepID=A0AAW0J677_QUESU
MDPKCPLCNASPKSSLHLFVYCHVARFLWASNEWSCRPDAMQCDCPGQFINFLLSPQVFFHGSSDREGFLLFGALVLEQLWFARNQAIHKEINFSPNKELQVVLKKFSEHHVVLFDVPLVLPRHFYSWIRPEQEAVKINCDAAVGLDHSFIAIVARDCRGYLILSMSKRVESILPIQAEAEAINLATCVTVNRGFEYVVVESNAKACIDALKAPFDEVPWRISSIIADTLWWAFCGQQFVFRWSPRESNK